MTPMPPIVADPAQRNARDLERELQWFAEVLDARFRLYFGNEECTYGDVLDVSPPELDEPRSEYAQLIDRLGLGFIERLALILALTPHLRPQLLDVFFLRNAHFDRPFTEFGGIVREPHSDFQPTVQTLMFIVAGRELGRRFEVRRMLDPRHELFREDILRLEPTPGQGPQWALLRISPDALSVLTTGEPRRPTLGADFPAQRIETALTWDDLVLHPGTLAQIEEIHAFVEHGHVLMNDWGMAAKLRPGYRALFYGPPGTGKSMTACLLGKSLGRDVYRVDLSLVVSKYIGETEKNLAKVFDQAQWKSWILFFDEADALFGKRTETKDAKDRYANQEVAFLLQRIETFDGVAILASNLRENLDKAFTRRFESVVYFPVPRVEERLRLWRQGFSARAVLGDGVDMAKIAREHTLSGGAIMNVIRHASMQALRRGDVRIGAKDIAEGIRRELVKAGKG